MVPTTIVEPAATRLRTLGRVAEDDHRLAEGRRLLLDPAAVGEDHVGPLESPHELAVRQGLDDPDVLEPGDGRQDRLPDDRVPMDRKDDDEVGNRTREIRERLPDRPQPLAPGLAPVRRDEQHATAAGLEIAKRGILELRPALEREQQGVDHRVAGDDDLRCGHSLGEEIRSRGRGRSEVERGDLGDEPAVDLFRIGRVPIPRSQPRLDVRDRDAVVVGGERTREGGRRVPLDEDEVGRLLFERLRQAADRSNRHVRRASGPPRGCRDPDRA